MGGGSSSPRGRSSTSTRTRRLSISRVTPRCCAEVIALVLGHQICCTIEALCQARASGESEAIREDEPASCAGLRVF